VHVELVIDVEPGTWVEDWDRLPGTSPNPNARTTAEAIAAALSREEAERFEAHLRPLVDAGRGLMRSAFAYLWALKSTGTPVGAHEGSRRGPATLPRGVADSNPAVPQEGPFRGHRFMPG
jgi:hypothetical protein